MELSSFLYVPSYPVASYRIEDLHFEGAGSRCFETLVPTHHSAWRHISDVNGDFWGEASFTWRLRGLLSSTRSAVMLVQLPRHQLSGRHYSYCTTPTARCDVTVSRILWRRTALNGNSVWRGICLHGLPWHLSQGGAMLGFVCTLEVAV